MDYNYDIDANGNLVKSLAEKTGEKETATGSIHQFSDNDSMEVRNKTKTGKRKKTDFTHTGFDPEKQEVKVRDYSSKKGDDGLPGVSTYPTHYAGKENKALPKKSFSSDDVTVARLLKDKSPEEADAILKAISSVYTTGGALSSKRSGGAEGVKLMGEMDKVKNKKPSELDPNKPAVSGMSTVSPSKAPTPDELTNRKPNQKALDYLTKKSIADACDEILNKAKGTEPKKRSSLDEPFTPEEKYKRKKFDEKAPAREAHAAKKKETLASVGRAVAHFRSKADEGFGENEEKSYSLDFNKSILERMGLEKGRKSAWESKETKEDSDVRVPHSSDSSAGNLNPETESRMQGIRESGDEKNKKRMATSDNPSDVAYARKKGWI